MDSKLSFLLYTKNSNSNYLLIECQGRCNSAQKLTCKKKIHFILQSRMRYEYILSITSLVFQSRLTVIEKYIFLQKFTIFVSETN